MESVFGLSTITMYGMMENVVLPVCLGGRIFKHHHRMKNNKKKNLAVRTAPKTNQEIVETCKADTPNTYS